MLRIICSGLSLLVLANLGWAQAQDAKPKLVVICVFDQLRGDYPLRWKEQFGAGGFRRIMDQGTHFTNCHYPYAITVTGPGHASIGTGALPSVHGIIGNDWYDTALGQSVYCASSNRYKNFPEKPGTKKDGGSPERLLVPTIGDNLKDSTGGKSKVISISSKDRGAILLAGSKSNGCFWWDTDTGLLGSSTFFGDALPGWVSDWNREGFAKQWVGTSWERFRTDLDYSTLSGPDEVRGEGEGVAKKQGRVFPHPFPKELGKDYFNSVYFTPMANEVLLSAAFKAIDAENLGKQQSTDLLLLSFSSNDVVGHTWGPDSQEVMDTTLRTDDLLSRLFNQLDQKVGKGAWSVYLSADHGVCPLPEVSLGKGLDAGRIDPTVLKLNMEKHLHEAFGEQDPKVSFFAGARDENLYLNQRYLKSRGLDYEIVAKSLARWLETQKGIQKAFTRGELIDSKGKPDALKEMCQKSFHPDRSGDLMVIFKPYWLVGVGTGTTHGAPHPYDTHVPLMILGGGIPKLCSEERVVPQHVASIIASQLGIPAPKGCGYGVPESLQKSLGK